MIDAARRLLAVALANAMNEKFILLSESDIPLYAPGLVYSQLIAEPWSRMDACGSAVCSQSVQPMHDSLIVFSCLAISAFCSECSFVKSGLHSMHWHHAFA